MIVTDVPTEPEVGLRLLMPGGGVTVKLTPLLVPPPPPPLQAAVQFGGGGDGGLKTVMVPVPGVVDAGIATVILSGAMFAAVVVNLV